MSDDTITARQSAIEQLRASFKQEQANRQHDFRVPGWDGLWITCRALDDFTEVRERVAPALQPGSQPNDQAIAAAGEMILLACVGSHILNPDGTRIDLAPLGVELAQTLLGDDGDPNHAPQNDRQALSMLIPASMARYTLAQHISQWSNKAGALTEAELAGE